MTDVQQMNMSPCWIYVVKSRLRLLGKPEIGFLLGVPWRGSVWPVIAVTLVIQILTRLTTSKASESQDSHLDWWNWKLSPAFMCWEFPPQMALMISCDLINKDLIVKLNFFILYLNLCNIFRWDNFVYGKYFYIERIYCQYLLYIYCHVFLVFS